MTNNNNDQQYPSWEHDPEIHGYWVVTGRLLATEYPGAKDEEKALWKLQILLDAGINSFVDLTEAGERTWDETPMVPYNGLLGSDVNYRRFAIPDTSVIDDAGYDRILDYIQAEHDAGRVVSCHCWGGKGRTGTVVGSWLIDNEGVGYPEVIDRMQELRRGSSKEHHPVPDTDEQHDVLRRRAQRKGD
jgi:protein-tyrosine phosphatase